MGTVVVLVGIPAVKLRAGHDAEPVFHLGVPVTVDVPVTSVATRWGPARVTVEEARAGMQWPVAALPWWITATIWGYTALGAALILLVLHELRRIFQRVRGGAPFDAGNALCLRRAGVLLVALAVCMGLGELTTTLLVGRGLESTVGVRVASGLHLDGSLVVFGLVLVALAEVFRRGADLEHEQSLVI